MPTRSVCIGCEQTGRDTSKRSNRMRSKVIDTTRRHADRLGFPRAEFVVRFGWEVDRMLHDLEHAYANGCPYCSEAFSKMGHGLSDITLDVCDRRLPPFYGINTRWVCQTCNREKGRTPPELWGAKLMSWQQWHAYQQRLKTNPLAGLPLFERAA